MPTDPSGNFGFIKGELYTLRWDPVGKGSKAGIVNRSGNKVIGCQGDMNTAGFIPGADNNGQRGYIDLQTGGGGGGAAFIGTAADSGISTAHKSGVITPSAHSVTALRL